MSFLIKWLVNIIALLAVIRIVPGITAGSWETAVIAASILGLLNAFLKPLIMLLTLPINILSLGILTLVINGCILYLASEMVAGFDIDNFASAFKGAFLFSIISFLLNIYLRPFRKERGSLRFNKNHPGRRDRNIIDVKGKFEKT